MIISRQMFVIATKERPVEFIDPDNCNTVHLENAYFYSTTEVLNSDLEEFDDPSIYEIWPVTVSYEF